MNRYPMWKNLAILLALVVGALYAMPNLYPDDLAVHVSTEERTADDALFERVERALSIENIPVKGIQFDESSVVARFENGELQDRAKEVLEGELGNGYVVIPSFERSTPDWLRSIGGEPMVYGLDLRGGVHFLMEVDMDEVRKTQTEAYEQDIKAILREERIRYRTVRQVSNGVLVQLRKLEDLELAEDLISDQLPDLEFVERDEVNFRLRTKISDLKLQQIADVALQQNIATLRGRVNQLGVAEPVVQQQGASRIVIQLPGLQDPRRARDILGITATLEYRAVDETNNPQTAASSGNVPGESRLYEFEGQPILLSRSLIVSGQELTDAIAGVDSRDGRPQVTVTLNQVGANRMIDFTTNNVGNRMAVVFKEYIPEITLEDDGTESISTRITEEVISVAVVREPFGKRFQTTGLDSADEAKQLALSLRAGALAAPVAIIEERTVGPSLGAENIEKGFKSVLIGFVVVLVFMAIYYRAFGLVANLALAANVVLVVAVLSLFGATLTLPGIAGVVLTVGMAVDANVLIFERIREELRNGMTPQSAIRSGYEKAFSTIADANITTLIAAVVLLSFGTGPIKGFAVTLSIGILTSMFTAIMGTRAVVNLIYGGRSRLKSLAI